MRKLAEIVKDSPIITLKVGTIPVPVYLEPDLEHDGVSVLGLTVTKDLEDGQGPRPFILLSSWGRTPNHMKLLFHEVLHVLEFLYGLELEEQDVRTLEQTVCDLFIQNPGIMRDFTDTLIPEPKSHYEPASRFTDPRATAETARH